MKYRILKSKSYQDVLTGLWNRAYTENAVNEMISQGKKVLFLCLIWIILKQLMTITVTLPGDETL